MESSRKSPAEAVDAVTAAVHTALRAAKPGPILVAFSGGLDSSVLLHAANNAAPARVHAAHIHHGLQAAADAFEAHCVVMCRLADIRLEVLRIHLAIGPGESVEARAREGRYAALKDHAFANQCVEVWTAHHRDDQIETLLLALARGADLKGLAGIAPKRALGSTSLVRPLLQLPRAALQAYAHAHGLRWIDDPTNTELTFRRNRVRAQAIPVLEACLPGFGAMAARSVQRLQAQLGRQELAPTTAPTKSVLLALNPSEQAKIVRSWLASEGVPAMGERKLLELLKQCTGSSAYGQVHHHRWEIRRYRDAISLHRSNATSTQWSVHAVSLPANGQTVAVGNARVEILEHPASVHRLAVEPMPMRASFRGPSYRHSRSLRLWCQSLGIGREARKHMAALVAYGAGEGAQRVVVYVDGLGVNQHAVESGWRLGALPAAVPL
jgi:tRNA(Ile)-lysidine synthase